MTVMTSRVRAVRLGPARWKVQPEWKLTSPRAKGSSTIGRAARPRAAANSASLSSEIGRSRPTSTRWLPTETASGPISSGVSWRGTQAVQQRSLASGQSYWSACHRVWPPPFSL